MTADEAVDALNWLCRALQAMVALGDRPATELSPAEWQIRVNVAAGSTDWLNVVYAPPRGFALLAMRSRSHLEDLARICSPVIQAECRRLLERPH